MVIPVNRWVTGWAVSDHLILINLGTRTTYCALISSRWRTVLIINPIHFQVDCATAASVSSLPGGSADSPDPVTPVLVMLPTSASSSPTWIEVSKI